MSKRKMPTEIMDGSLVKVLQHALCDTFECPDGHCENCLCDATEPFDIRMFKDILREELAK
jgi:hypothetical protein